MQPFSYDGIFFSWAITASFLAMPHDGTMKTHHGRWAITSHSSQPDDDDHYDVLRAAHGTVEKLNMTTYLSSTYVVLCTLVLLARDTGREFVRVCVSV